MHKRKILITGSSGTIGSYISSVFPDDELLLTTRQNFDITNEKSVLNFFENSRPAIAIHLAAKTNVDACEKDEKEAHRVNSLGTQYIAKACAKINARLVYLSTGAVFNGKKKYYIETDKPDPANIYGKTKLLGEDATRKIDNRNIIIRAGWVIGGKKTDKKFISYILQQIKEGRKIIHVVNDKFGTLTYAKEIAAFIKMVLEQHNSKGIYHFSSIGTCSRYAIAKHLVNLLGKKVEIVPVSSKMFADRFHAPRPTHEVLHSIRFPSSLFNSWRKSLTSFIKNDLYE